MDEIFIVYSIIYLLEERVFDFFVVFISRFLRVCKTVGALTGRYCGDQQCNCS